MKLLSIVIKLLKKLSVITASRLFCNYVYTYPKILYKMFAKRGKCSHKNPKLWYSNSWQYDHGTLWYEKSDGIKVQNGIPYYCDYQHSSEPLCFRMRRDGDVAAGRRVSPLLLLRTVTFHIKQRLLKHTHTSFTLWNLSRQNATYPVRWPRTDWTVWVICTCAFLLDRFARPHASDLSNECYSCPGRTRGVIPKETYQFFVSTQEVEGEVR